MSKIKKFFLTLSAMATMMIFKVGGVFAAVPVDIDIWGQGKNFIGRGDPTLYGIPDPEPVNDFGTIFGKIALFVLLPLFIIALITVGIIALVKVNKKKKQVNVNMNQSINNNNNNGNTNS